MVAGKAIYGHRCILSARCEILEKMLNGPMKENECSVIALPDVEVSYDVFLMLIEYLYTESVNLFKKLPIDTELLLDLLKLADQYLVNNLKVQCEVLLGNSVDVERVCQMFEVADAHRSTILKKKCMEFIANNFGSVITQNAFLDLPKPLLKEILEEVSHRGICVGQKRSIGNNSTIKVIP
jgi:hypothetical protein